MRCSMQNTRTWLLLGVLTLSSAGEAAQEAATPAAKPTQPPIIDPDGSYHVGNGVTPPRLISSVDAEFSDAARRKKVGGRAILSLVVGTDGVPKDIRVQQSIAEDQPGKLRAAARSLDEKAVEAVRQYRFSPGTYQEKPVPVAIKIEVNFHVY